MSGISSIEAAIALVTGDSATVAKIETIVEAILAAAPAIEAGIASAAPYVQAIVTMVKTGGAPSDAQWAELQSSLDAGSQTLADAAKAAQQEIDSAVSGEGEAQ